MKITVEHYDTKVTIEKDHDDVIMEEMYQMLKELCLAIGFHPDTVNEFFESEL